MVDHECISCKIYLPKDSFLDAYGRLPKVMQCRACLDTVRKKREAYARGEAVEGTKQCVGCNADLPFDQFPRRVDSKGRHYPNARCHSCQSTYRRPRRKRNLEVEQCRSEREKLERVNDPAPHILKASRASDKLNGRENNMTVEWIRASIANGCSYCGDHNLRMTVDRQDNTIGHTTNNVVPCCYQCNMIKRDMPQAAWDFIKDRIVEAKKLGLFGQWLTTPFARKNKKKGAWELD